MCCSFFFLNDTAPPEISTLPLPDALPIWRAVDRDELGPCALAGVRVARLEQPCEFGRKGIGHCGLGAQPAGADRKSTRLNSSHANISYAVFCLKKKHSGTPTVCLDSTRCT